MKKMGQLNNKSNTEELEHFPFIEGELIDLCPRSSKHTAYYARWKNDPIVRKYFRNMIPITLEDQKKRAESREQGLSDHISFDIWHKKDGKPIGVIGLGRINWVNGWANAFIHIGEKEYWGKDIATEATTLLLEYAFNELNMHKIHGGAAVDNIGSWSVAEKLGFAFEGIERDDFYVDGKYVDSKVYRITKEDWLQRKREKK
jgi:RimJ/RimL family protein N-acetyltransferase